MKTIIQVVLFTLISVFTFSPVFAGDEVDTYYALNGYFKPLDKTMQRLSSCHLGVIPQEEDVRKCIFDWGKGVKLPENMKAYADFKKQDNMTIFYLGFEFKVDNSNARTRLYRTFHFEFDNRKNKEVLEAMGVQGDYYYDNRWYPFTTSKETSRYTKLVMVNKKTQDCMISEKCSQFVMKVSIAKLDKYTPLDPNIIGYNDLMMNLNFSVLGRLPMALTMLNDSKK